jgi:hypothetical protein
MIGERVKLRNKIFKVLIVSMVMALIVTSFTGIGFAKEHFKNQDKEIGKLTKQQEKEIEKLAKELEFIWGQASIKDELGNIVDFDLEMIQNEFGNNYDLTMLKELTDENDFIIENPRNKDINKISSFVIFEPKSSLAITKSLANDNINNCVNEAIYNEYKVYFSSAGIATIVQALFDGNFKFVASKIIKLGVKTNAVGLVAWLAYVRIICQDGKY